MQKRNLFEKEKKKKKRRNRKEKKWGWKGRNGIESPQIWVITEVFPLDQKW